MDHQDDMPGLTLTFLLLPGSHSGSSHALPVQHEQCRLLLLRHQRLHELGVSMFVSSVPVLAGSQNVPGESKTRREMTILTTLFLSRRGREFHQARNSLRLFSQLVHTKGLPPTVETQGLHNKNVERLLFNGK